jgi:hypothetical protein
LDIHKLIPILGPNEASTLLGDSEQWRNFGRRIQHHPAMHALLREKQNHRCLVCGCGLEGALTIHHVSYINRCKTDQVLSIPTPTPKRPNKSVQAPPCGDCELLSKCSALLALVHDGCHVRIHALEAKLKVVSPQGVGEESPE